MADLTQNEVQKLLKDNDDYLDIMLGLVEFRYKAELINFRDALRSKNPTYKDNIDLHYMIESKSLLKYRELCQKD